ncbi:6-cysteine protein [Plasmodium gonderi]|uniref:6-cysteine protein n=1 Tax=Plasmodium gonderi TaxID=77519 RepID=A0A1Y1JGL6_PLAGO|nr:6-cysteine protein [Plasmodium gonderi]GAW79224.1 6-cysteine protein [Plasmodium gonderi]
MTQKMIFLGWWSVYCILKWVTICRKINSLVNIGHIHMCKIDMRTDEAQECVLENEFGKAFLFVCNEVHTANFSSNVIPSQCANRTFVNQNDPNENSADSDTYEVFQNLIGANNSILKKSFLFYSTPYSSKDIDLSCLCYGDNKIKHMMKIVFKKTSKKIKGCDFGYNMMSRRDLTNNINLNTNSSCVIHAYPGDVVGINCNKKENNHIYNENLELEPSNCFHSVYYGKDIILSSKNLIPNSRVIPDPAADVNLTKMHSYMSYIILPKDMTMTGKISCYCKKDQYVGSMFIYLKTLNNFLFDSNNEIDQIIEKGSEYGISDDESYRNGRKNGKDKNLDRGERENNNGIKQNNERIEDIHDHYSNINSIYYNTGINYPYKGKDDFYDKNEYQNAKRKSNTSQSMDADNTYNYRNNINDPENRGNKMYNDEMYDAYSMSVAHELNRPSVRRIKRTLWQNLFGLSSSQSSSFNFLVLAFFLLIQAYCSPL